MDSPLMSNIQYPEKLTAINIGMSPTQIMDSPMTSNIQYPEKLATINIGMLPTQRMESANVRFSTRRLENDLRLGCLKYKQNTLPDFSRKCFNFFYFSYNILKVYSRVKYAKIKPVQNCKGFIFCIFHAIELLYVI